MTTPLSEKAQLLSQRIVINQNFVLEIEDFDELFGAVPIEVIARIGMEGLEIGNFNIGGLYDDPNSRDWISLQGTTTNLTQQLNQNKGGTSSVTLLKVDLVDKEFELTNIFSPGVRVDDLLSKKANFYALFGGSAFPEDAVRLFSGIITGHEFGSSNCILTISHPEELKRANVFQITDDELSSGISDVDTVIPLNSPVGFFEPGDIIKTYIIINEEIIEYTGVSGNNLTGAIRGSLGTTSSAHDAGDSVAQAYGFAGQPIEMALKLMLSRDDDFFEEYEIKDIGQLKTGSPLQNAITFDEVNIEDKLGLIVGDFVSIVNSGIGGNNITERAIASFGQQDDFSFIVLEGSDLVIEAGSPAQARFKSQFDTLPIGTGLGMTPEQVDVPEHLRLDSLFSTNFPDYDFFITEDKDGKNFIDEQLYFPAGLFSLPRLGKASIGYTSPPVPSFFTKIIGAENVANPSSIKISRSLSKNFYNAIVYKYGLDRLTGEFLNGFIEQSADSTNRIKVPNRPLKIESEGLRRNAATDAKILNISTRFLDRYKFAAESVQVSTNYKTGFNVDPGDILAFDGASLKVADIATSSRRFNTRLMEVTRKVTNLKTGQITMTLTDTSFSINGRYTTIGPSSKLDTGSTTDYLQLKEGSFFTLGIQREQDKWQDFIGERISVRSSDWTTFNEVTTIQGFDNNDPSRMLIDPPLSSSPLEDYIVDVPEYSTSADPNSDRLYKIFVAFLNPRIDVTGGTDNFTFEVGAGDISKLFINSFVRIHSDDYSDDSGDLQISNIVGNTITVNDDMGFTPAASGYVIDLVGFSADEGLPYRFV